MNLRDERLLCALLETGSVGAAASAVGISRGTAYKRLSDPAFREEYERRRREVLNAATAALQNGLLSAVSAITEILDDALAAPQTKLNAAALLLQNAARFTELCGVAAKVAALEDRIKLLSIGDDNIEATAY